jgi:hypothetical protein
MWSTLKRGGPHANITIQAPRAIYEQLNLDEQPLRAVFRRAFNAVLPGQWCVDDLYVSAQLLDTLDPNWRTELLEIAAGRGVHNQAVDIPKREIVIWRNLRFRSQSEVRVAMALDAAGVLFLPNCLGRLGSQEHRLNREADFLVCHEGKWGCPGSGWPLPSPRSGRP